MPANALLSQPMPAPLRIVLTQEEDQTLTELRVAPKLPQRIRDRAHMLRLNAQGWNVPARAFDFQLPGADGQSHASTLGESGFRGTVVGSRSGSKTEVA